MWKSHKIQDIFDYQNVFGDISKIYIKMWIALLTNVICKIMIKGYFYFGYISRMGTDKKKW